MLCAQRPAFRASCMHVVCAGARIFRLSLQQNKAATLCLMTTAESDQPELSLHPLMAHWPAATKLAAANETLTSTWAVSKQTRQIQPLSLSLLLALACLNLGQACSPYPRQAHLWSSLGDGKSTEEAWLACEARCMPWAMDTAESEGGSGPSSPSSCSVRGTEQHRKRLHSSLQGQQLIRMCRLGLMYRARPAHHSNISWVV